eukprot:CAMPEP_0182889282 /NCGR_PEP_ID=MMETSP0034_2-20130328/21950_1 /TAXON_ID=156128 /ORGANISM="Nephroselmis pyriformis, Strain CCMP717" /LENGTH=281 /DNA_ID=CAMNT_0025022771 /DNA_START=28 /DNA_END=873 /DNA_ORIENTATION=-
MAPSAAVNAFTALTELLPKHFQPFAVPILAGVLLSTVLTSIGMVGMLFWYMDRTVAGYKQAVADAEQAARAAQAAAERANKILSNTPSSAERSPYTPHSQDRAPVTPPPAPREWHSPPDSASGPPQKETGVPIETPGAGFVGEWRVDKAQSDPLDPVMAFLGYGPETVEAAGRATVSHTIACDNGMITLRDWEVEGHNEATSSILARDGSTAPRVVSRIYMDHMDLVQEESHPDTGHVLTVRRFKSGPDTLVATCSAKVVLRGKVTATTPEVRRVFLRVQA